VVNIAQSRKDHTRAERAVLLRAFGGRWRAEVGFNHRRIRNLSDRQRQILSPKVDRSEVSV
jgi:hypothetical protein